MRPRVPPERDPKLLEWYLQRKVTAHVRAARERIEQKLQASLAGTHQRLAESMLRRHTELMARAGFELQIADPAVADREPAARKAAPQVPPQVVEEQEQERAPDEAGRVTLRY